MKLSAHSTAASAPENRAGKLQTTVDTLEKLARQHGPGEQLPTIRQLRTLLEVSNSTLTAALNALERGGTISRRQGSGIYVSEQIHQRHLCLLCNPAFLVEFGESPFWHQIFYRTEKRAADRGERLTLHFTQPLPPQEETPYADPSALHKGLIEQMTAGNIHGVLAIGLTHPQTRWIEQLGIPVVAFAGPANFIVMFSDSELIQRGVAELAKRGCRRIAFWTSAPRTPQDPWFLTSRETFAAALKAQDRASFPELAQPVLPANTRINSYRSPVHEGFEQTMRCFGPQSDPRLRPDGILSGNDMVTQGALMAMQKCGVVIGKDVLIATHANTGSPVLLAWQEHLLRLEFDSEEIVQCMFDTLDELIPEPGTSPKPYLAGTQTEHIFFIRPRLLEPVPPPQADMHP